jgi:hypothetical protein
LALDRYGRGGLRPSSSLETGYFLSYKKCLIWNGMRKAARKYPKTRSRFCRCQTPRLERRDICRGCPVFLCQAAILGIRPVESATSPGRLFADGARR